MQWLKATFAQNQSAKQAEMRMHVAQVCQRCRRQVPCKSEKGFATFDRKSRLEIDLNNFNDTWMFLHDLPLQLVI